MALDINGYNATFRAFTDFAKVMTEGKGGMNSIARVETGVDITTGALAGKRGRAIDRACAQCSRLSKTRITEEFSGNSCYGFNHGTHRCPHSRDGNVNKVTLPLPADGVLYYKVGR